MGGKHKVTNIDSGCSEDTTNGFHDYHNDNRRQRRNQDEARPLRRSFENLRRASPADVEIVNNARHDSGVNESDPCDSILAHFKMPDKSRLPFFISVILCVILLVIVIFLIAFWPQIPYYMKADVCTQKECLDASQQMLMWANTSVDACQNPYEWACGKFAEEYYQHSFYGIKSGEWNFDSYREYQEIRNLDSFISQLPSYSLSDSVPSIIKGLYKSCRELENLDKAQSEYHLKKAINSLDGWREGKRLQIWDHKKALIHLQAMFGSFPFFKVSVENRVVFPYDKIITIDEGEVGLPHKYFYNLESNHKIITSYKMLLRDFAINMGIVAEQAKMFADEIFHYEQRIVNRILSTQLSSDRRLNQIVALGEIKKIAPSLPIIDSVQAIFSKTKITEKTEVLVRDMDVLEAMSIIVSTSDKMPLNDFVIWSLARKFLPYMSREYRVTVEDFEQVLYGYTKPPPKWYFCSKIVRDWVPFAIDALDQNPNLLMQTNQQTSNIDDQPISENLQKIKEGNNEELFKMIFYHIRNELQNSIENADWIRQNSKQYINDMLSKIKLQIGIPSTVLESNIYINEYYQDFLLQNLFFVQHLEPFWNFEKSQMEKKLKTGNAIDAVIYELYPGFGHRRKALTYNSGLNMAIVSKKLLHEPYFNYKYPISMNFARVGTDVAELLLQTALVYADQYNEKLKTTNSSESNISIIGASIECLKQDIGDKAKPNDAIINLYKKLSATNLASKSLISFHELVKNSNPISGTAVTESTNYDSLELKNRQLQPGMRKFEDHQMFTLAQLQKYCSIADESYKTFKPFIEGEIAKDEMFDLVWNHLPCLPHSLYCSSRAKKCSDIL